jgi:hypothetical protein
MIMLCAHNIEVVVVVAVIMTKKITRIKDTNSSDVDALEILNPLCISALSELSCFIN